MLKKLRAQAARLDQGDRPLDQAGDDDAGKAGARADVEPGRAGPRLEANELRRIEDMPLPQPVERRCRNQVLALAFGPQQRRIGVQLLECFT